MAKLCAAARRQAACIASPHNNGFCMPCLSVQAVSAVLQELPPLDSCTSSAWLDWQPGLPPPAFQRPCSSDPSAASCLPGASQRPASQAPGAQLRLGYDSAVQQGLDCTGGECLDYSDQQLDLLAVLFTAVKMLYIGGALTAAERLCTLIEPARRASRRPLHTTRIRNEAAYYGCVLQLLRGHPPPPWPPEQLQPLLHAPVHCVGVDAGGAAGGSAGSSSEHAAGSASAAAATAALAALPRPLYLLGDSHCLSGECACWLSCHGARGIWLGLSIAMAPSDHMHCQPHACFHTYYC